MALNCSKLNVANAVASNEARLVRSKPAPVNPTEKSMLKKLEKSICSKNERPLALTLIIPASIPKTFKFLGTRAMHKNLSKSSVAKLVNQVSNPPSVKSVLRSSMLKVIFNLS